MIGARPRFAVKNCGVIPAEECLNGTPEGPQRRGVKRLWPPIWVQWQQGAPQVARLFTDDAFTPIPPILSILQ